MSQARRPWPWLGAHADVPSGNTSPAQPWGRKGTLLWLKTVVFKREIHAGFQHLVPKNAFKTLGCPLRSKCRNTDSA